MPRLVDPSHPVLRRQAPLLALIVVITGMFFAQLVGESWYLGLMVVPAEIAASWDRILAGQGAGADWAELASLLGSAFLHGNLEHLALNMLFLWVFGALISELLGWRWMLLTFALTAIGGSVTHTVMNAEEFIPMLGASGAVMGFEGAYLGLAVRWRLPDPHVWPMARPIPPAHLALLAVVGVAIDYASIMQGSETGVAYGAHIGGFTMGLLLASVVMPRPAAAGS